MTLELLALLLYVALYGVLVALSYVAAREVVRAVESATRVPPITATWSRRARHTRAAVLGQRNTRVVPHGQVTLRFGNGPDTDGTFEGYANLHNVTDSYGTRFLPGSWRSGGLDTGTYPLLVMHDPTRVAGTFTAREDERGLRIEGRFDPTTEGQDARARAQSGSASELSVGFGRFATLADDETGINLAELVEVSLITSRMASQPGAEMTGVRSAADLNAGAVRTPEATRAYVVLPGTVEERLQHLGGAVSAWATETFGERTETNRWHASTEGTYDDHVVVTVRRYTSDYELEGEQSYRLDYTASSDGVTIGEVSTVEVSAVVTPTRAAGLPSALRLAHARARLLLSSS